MVPGAVGVNGLYALASLDGAPLRARDFAALGLSPAADEARGRTTMACVVRDPDPGAIHLRDCTAFLGYLDEPEEVAATLGQPPTMPHGELAAAAIARFGDEAPSRLLGEWSFLHWHAQSRTLTLASSEPVRDAIMFATDGRRVAVAPDIHTLRRLDWLDGMLDPCGLLLHMGRTRRRATITGETIMRGVRRVPHGTRVTITPDGVRTSVRRAWPAPECRRGSFDDLVFEVDAVLRRSLSQHLRRHRKVAVLLSGGLDSSLVAAYCASATDAPASSFCLTSAAPPGSGLPDDVPFAAAVADRTGLPIQPVVPGGDVSLYRPSARTLAWLQYPLAAPAHYLYDALFAAAVRGGASAVLDGAYGELTLTAYAPAAPWWHGAGAAVRAARAMVRESSLVPRPLQQDFHPRLADPALRLASTGLRQLPTRPDPQVRQPDRSLWGYLPGAAKLLGEDSGTPWPRLRRVLPFRDRRLLDLFAGMPASFATRNGVDRAPARSLLRGKVPESVRLRMDGRPFSPDYFLRAHHDAAAARARIAGHARAGFGEWLDLEWLDSKLRLLEAGVPTSVPLVFEVQATAVAAEFLRSWFGDEDHDER